MKTCIFDWKRTLYDPQTHGLIDGALDVLKWLQSQQAKVVLIGKGTQDMYDEVDRLGVKAYFSYIHFREGPKDISLYTQFIDIPRPKDTVIIGDRITSEISVGNSLGATTIWIRQGKFADEAPTQPQQQPNHTITALPELVPLLTQLGV